MFPTTYEVRLLVIFIHCLSSMKCLFLSFVHAFPLLTYGTCVCVLSREASPCVCADAIDRLSFASMVASGWTHMLVLMPSGALSPFSTAFCVFRVFLAFILVRSSTFPYRICCHLLLMCKLQFSGGQLHVE